MSDQQVTSRLKALDVYKSGVVVAIRDPIKILDLEFYKPMMKRGGELMFPELKGMTGRRVDKNFAPWDKGNFAVKISEWVDGKELVSKDWYEVDYNSEEFTYVDKDAKSTGQRRWIENDEGKLIPVSRRKSKFFSTGTVPFFTGEAVFISYTDKDGRRVTEQMDNFYVYLKGRVMQQIWSLAAKEEEMYGKVPPLMYFEFVVKQGAMGEYIDGVAKVDSEKAMANWKLNQKKHEHLVAPKMTPEKIDEVEKKLYADIPF